MGTRHAINEIYIDLPPLPVELVTSTIDAHLGYRGHQGQAVELYASRLSWFLRWLRLVQPTGEITQLNFVQFHTWLTKIRSKRGDKPLGHELQQEILKRLRSALRWGFREGRLAHDYSSWVPAANYGSRDPDLLYDEYLLNEEKVWEPGSPLGLVTDPGIINTISINVVHSWVELFIAQKRGAGRLPTTLRDYHLRLTYYLAFVARNGNPLDALAPATIELYIAMRRASHSPATLFGDFACLRNFCGWLVKRHYLEVSPMLDLERPKKPRKRMRAVTYQQFLDLYRSVKGDDWLAKRDRLCLVLLFFSGLRASELVKLHVADIEESGLLYIRSGKGDVDRLVPYHPDVTFLARTYLAVRPDMDSPFLFVSSDGSGGVRGVMHYQGLKEMVRRRCKAANLPHFNLHSFRHGFAIAFLNADLQMSAVSSAMGHTSIDTTMIYARWSGTGLRTAYLAALARFAGNP